MALYCGLELEVPHGFSNDATDMLMKFYALEGETSPVHIVNRSARAWATFKGVTDWKLARRLQYYILNKWMLNASPQLSNAPGEDGKPRGLPISCFLGFVPDTVEGLIDHSTELRMLSVMGGGVGGHWSSIRTASTKAPGPIPFIHTVDADMEAWRQGITRKGSYAAYLDVTHPDILEFISIRTPTGDIQRKAFNLHHGVNITDDFMAAVCQGEDYELVDPKIGPTGQKISARLIWEKLLETRYRTGEPYLHFIDTANNGLHPAQQMLGLRINGSNLCIEIELATNEERTAVCCLASPNAELYHEWKNTSLIRDMVTMLDNVLEYFIEQGAKKSYISKAVHSAKSERSIGIGCMGFHTLLQKMGIPFESQEATALNKELFSHIRAEAEAATSVLALERGEPSDLIGHNRRNAHLMAVAPNANTGYIFDVSPSIEPAKANAFTQRTRAGSTLVKNRYLSKILEKYGKDDETTWKSITLRRGSVQHLGFLTDHERNVFKTANEINQHWIVMHAADRQNYIDQGQSVNLFFPAGATREYVQKVHMLAWELGVKGLYYLRTEAPVQVDQVSADQETLELGAGIYTVYGTPNCQQCATAKRLLEIAGKKYVYVDLTVIGKTAAEITGNSATRSVPQIKLGDTLIGGLQELRTHLYEAEMGEDSTCISCEG